VTLGVTRVVQENRLVEPTQEQRRARDAFAGGGDLAVVAGAGTGKTSTLLLMAAATRKRGLYLAFNRAIATDAARRFGRNVECRTAHSLAFAATGRPYRDRLNSSARIPAAEVARILGISRELTVGYDRVSRVQQARMVMDMVRRFCFSGDSELNARHMEPVNGLTHQETDDVAGVLLRYAIRAWDDIRAPQGKLRFEHDHYMKLWALTKPMLSADFVLLDEAQDTNPVLEKIFLAQPAQRVCVGDPAQQIYAWRAARDVMTRFTGAQLRLTRSFRFGPPIAAVANRWLRHAASDMELTGAGDAGSRVGLVDGPANVVLCRGNADVIREVLGFLATGTRVAVTGGGLALSKLAEAAIQLKSGRRTSHPELFLFPDWGAVQDYAEHDSAAHDLKTLVRLVDAHGPEKIVDAMGRLSSEEDAAVTVSTAHKAKGREWDSVRIGPGFGPPLAGEGEEQQRLSLEEARLIYVAVTRARRALDTAGLSWADAYEKAIAAPKGPLWRTVRSLPLAARGRRAPAARHACRATRRPMASARGHRRAPVGSPGHVAHRCWPRHSGEPSARRPGRPRIVPGRATGSAPRAGEGQRASSGRRRRSASQRHRWFACR
jgi:hypothetical protein